MSQDEKSTLYIYAYSGIKLDTPELTSRKFVRMYRIKEDDSYSQRCQTHGAKLWNRHFKIMVHYGTCLQDACAARNSN